MKKFILLFLLILPLTACSSTPIPHNGVRLKIAGMTCEPCAQTLMKKFSKEKTIQSAFVDWETGEGIITQKPDEKISDVTIEKIVDWSGFELISIER